MWIILTVTLLLTSVFRTDGQGHSLPYFGHQCPNDTQQLYEQCNEMDIQINQLNQTCEDIKQNISKLESYVGIPNDNFVEDTKPLSEKLNDIEQQFKFETEKVNESFKKCETLASKQTEEINKIISDVITHSEKLGNLERHTKAAIEYLNETAMKQQHELEVKHEILANDSSHLQELFSTKNEETRKNFDTLTNNMSSVIADTFHRLKDLQEKINNVKEDHEQTRKNSDSNNLKIDERVQDANEAREDITRLQTKFDSLEKKYETERLRLDEIKNQVYSLERRLSSELLSFETKFDEKLMEVKDAATLQVHATESGLGEKIREQQKKVDIILPNTFNKESVSMVGVMLTVWMFVLTIAMVCMWSLRPRETSSLDQYSTQGLAQDQNGKPRSLQNNVVVISFVASQTQGYLDMMAPLREQHNVNSYNIRTDRDIAGIPTSKVCFMFVEFSERHVIIEEPGLGLGTLRRRTVEAVRRIGSCLVIVYARDPGSRSLHKGQRYNQNINCVKSQPELCQISDAEQFFSVYDKFTDFQEQCVKDIIAKNLE